MSQTGTPRMRVRVRADGLLYEGAVDGMGRLGDLLNDPRPFLTILDATVTDPMTGVSERAPEVVLNKGAITHVVPAGAAVAAAVGPMTMPMPPGSLPPAGPPTMPGPPPRGASKVPGDPPTQPYPRSPEEDDVSDLILDDDAESGDSQRIGPAGH